MGEYRSVLEAKVNEIFADIRIPPLEGILHENCRDVNAIIDFLSFAGKPWKLLPDRLIENNHDRLPFLSCAAFRSVLPAYLLYSIRHPESNVALFTSYAITPFEGDLSDSVVLNNHQRSQISSITKMESDVVSDAVSYIKSHRV